MTKLTSLKRLTPLLLTAGFLFQACTTDDDASGKDATISLRVQMPTTEVTGQARTMLSATDPVPTDEYTTFELTYTTPDGTSATATDNALRWETDGENNRFALLDFAPLQWKQMKRDGSPAATLTTAGSVKDTRTDGPRTALLTTTFAVNVEATAPTEVLKLAHTTARVAIVLRGTTPLVAAQLSALFDITTTGRGSVHAQPLLFSPGTDTGNNGLPGTPYALLHLSAEELTVAPGSRVVISRNGVKLFAIALDKLQVNVGGATTLLTTFALGQYFTLTVHVNDRFELTSTPTITIAPWLMDGEWTLNGNPS